MYQHSRNLFLKLKDVLTDVLWAQITLLILICNGLKKSGFNTVPYAVCYIEYKNMLQWRNHLQTSICNLLAISHMNVPDVQAAFTHRFKTWVSNLVIPCWNIQRYVRHVTHIKAQIQIPTEIIQKICIKFLGWILKIHHANNFVNYYTNLQCWPWQVCIQQELWKLYQKDVESQERQQTLSVDIFQPEPSKEIDKIKHSCT